MNFIEVENQHYILATSSFADQRTMVLKQDDTFAIFDYHGDIHQVGLNTQGIYHDGTRHISLMELKINGQRPMLLSSSPREDNQMLMVDLTNPDLTGKTGEIMLRGTVHIGRTKFIWKAAYHERIELVNFGLEPIDFDIELTCQADFSDIFEIRGTPRERRGINLDPVQTNEHVIFSYLGLDDVKRTTKVYYNPPPVSIDGTTARYNIYLLPKQKIALDVKTTFSQEREDRVALDFENSRKEIDNYIKKISCDSSNILTSNDQFNAWVTRSKSDLITMISETDYGLYPHAGVPWYSTPFGRDGIITAMECLWAEPALAKGVLEYLASTQAHEFNSFQDAEPGKIFHESRGGEMAALGEIPFKLYYGTIDATPLFISLAGNYLERTNDLTTIRKLWPNIFQALRWIDAYGDIDGDGFVEYKTKSSKGLTNQGWKDSHDAIFHEDGSLAEEPIALCEVQGYVYDAKIKASQMARALGYEDVSLKLKGEAAELKENFNNMFWSESKQTYALALDGKKKPCNVLSSNAGHCLFSGIATSERASVVAKNLLGDSMFSGWGIRTISSQERRFNPMSYHNGSIWPHDNAMIAYGFSQYHLMSEAAQILSSIFNTAEHVDDLRLPELFCGFKREGERSPISYPVACSPQAWSVGAVFMMIQACLGLKIEAKENLITLCYPVLPSFLNDITITNLRINDKIVVFQVRRNKEGLEAILLTPNTDISIKIHDKISESNQ